MVGHFWFCDMLPERSIMKTRYTGTRSACADEVAHAALTPPSSPLKELLPGSGLFGPLLLPLPLPFPLPNSEPSPPLHAASASTSPAPSPVRTKRAIRTRASSGLSLEPSFCSHSNQHSSLASPPKGAKAHRGRWRAWCTA